MDIKEVTNINNLREISLDDWEQTGDGGTAISYFHKTDDTLMLKVFITPNALNDAIIEVTRAQNVYSLGIPTPKVYELVLVDGKPAIIFERIIGKVSISRACANEPERIAKFAQIFAAEARKLHDTPCNTDLFPSIKDIYRKLLLENECIEDDVRIKIMTLLDSIPNCTTCCHGDFHPGNMILANNKPYWIDLGTFSYGVPWFDLGVLYFIFIVNQEDDRSNELFHMSNEQMQVFWDAFAAAYIQSESADDIKAFNEECQKYAAFFPLCFILSVNPKEVQPMLYELFMKELNI